MNLGLDQFRLSFAAFWAARNARERTMLAAAALVVIFGLSYILLIGPALVGRERLSKNLPELRRQVAQMQALAREAVAFAGRSVSAPDGNAASPSAISRQDIEAALARNGLKPQSITMTGDSTKVQLASVSFAGTLNWLDDMQKNARLSVVDANIVALTQPDMVNATFTLSQQRNE